MTDTFDYQAEKIAHRRCTQYRHNSGPGEPMYGFTAAHLLNFARELREELTKGQEQVGRIDDGRFAFSVEGGPNKWRERKGYTGPLYTRPTVAAPAGVPDGWKLVHQWRKTQGDSPWRDATKEEAYSRVDEHYEARTLYAAPSAPADAVAKDAEVKCDTGEPMSLVEAIAHARDKTGNGETECQRNHMQLAEWLEQLLATQAYVARLVESIRGITQCHEKELRALGKFMESNKLDNLTISEEAKDTYTAIASAKESLSTPVNLDALHEDRARECERLAGDGHLSIEGTAWLIEEAAAHRAKKEAA